MPNKALPKIDLNTAEESVLVKRFNLSPRVAKRIIAMRPYQSVDQLAQVWGIDPGTLQRMLAQVIVAGEPARPTNIQEPAPLPIFPPVKPALPAMEPAQPEIQPDFETPAVEPEGAAVFEEPPAPLPQKPRIDWKINLALALILLVGAYFRFSGLNWDDNHHQHPDERFITMVTDQIRGVSGIGMYFDTGKSTLNPLNFGSYTYGMLPLFFTRMIAEWANMATYDKITLAGRAVSGLFDLAAVLMLFLLGVRLYNRRVGLVAAALAAAAVLPIQLSHFYAVDSFSTVFVIACFYFGLSAVPIQQPGERVERANLVYFAIFGIMVGLAAACKVNTLPVFGVIVLAGAIYLASLWKKRGFRPALERILQGWGLALLAAFLAFRIFQPYAFSGPGFLGIEINPQWLKVLREVTDQVAGKSEWPPNHHWTNRPFSYAWTNMVLWGMGLPLGLAGWLGLAWAAWRSWKGDWRRHILPMVWVLGYFLWQNIQFWRYMRYFMPIYPFIILFAAWAMVELYDRTQESRARLRENGRRLALQLRSWRSVWQGAAVLLVLAVILVGTYGYAFAFTRIYTRPITRIAASEWMLENIPGPLNVVVKSPQGSQSYPISVYYRQVILPGDTPTVNLKVNHSGTVQKINSTRISQVGLDFSFRLSKDEKGDQIITDGHLIVPDDSTEEKQTIQFGDVHLDSGQTYYVHYKIHNSSRFSMSEVRLGTDNPDDPAIQLDLNFQDQTPGGLEKTLAITPDIPLRINRLQIGQFQQVFVPTETELKISLLTESDDAAPLAETSQEISFTRAGMRMNPSFTLPAIRLTGGKTYRVRYEITSGGPLQLQSDTYTLETGWDDALPLDINETDLLGGTYAPLILELYEPDTSEKRESMLTILAQSNYIVIPSNRSYDAMPRLPLRYPMTLKYYQALFGCDCSGDALENRAYGLQPPFHSPLGFDLVATFTSRPNLGPLTIPDESADESFTVYDHPKVMVFKKAADFSFDQLKNLLYSVDLDQVIFQTPAEYTQVPLAMQLPADRLNAQTNGGTWADIFNRSSLLNTNQGIGSAAWYLLILFLGWMIFPAVFTAFPGLPDRGYTLIRVAGLLGVTFLAWVLGSLKLLPFTRLAIVACIAVALLFCLALAYGQRNSLREYLRAHWKYILGTEVLFLILFLISLSIRIGNPDLWNPWLGGEKPMDFAFFNATLKAVYFPPEHPWFSGHYINYYYYGYVIAAVPTKLLGILPSIAYNLILPTWFAMIGVGVFGVSFNLICGLRLSESETFIRQDDPLQQSQHSFKNALLSRQKAPYLAGIIAVMLILFFGNLYLIREFWNYLPEVGSPGVEIKSPVERIEGVIAGATQVLTGQTDLPGNKDRWYFAPSRPILHDGPDTPIAEFPYFTFLYGDMHPHLLSMPIYALALGWILSLLLCPIPKLSLRERMISLGMAGLIFGSLRAAHTWDFPTFIGLGILAVGWNVWQTRMRSWRDTFQRFVVYLAAFVGLAVVLYLPFTQWFKTGYASIQLWTGARTPLIDYLFVFGLALFVMLSLMVRDLSSEIHTAARRWKLTSGGRLFSRPHLKVYGILLLCALVLASLWILHYQVLAFGLPLLVGIAYLVFFKRDLPVLHRIIWFLFGIGLAITLFVEVFVLEGDVGRSNMVFRFYLEAWFIFGIAVSASLIELLFNLPRQASWQKTAWIALLILFLLGSASYPLVATQKKIADRWPDVQTPPVTLDGAAYTQGNEGNTDPEFFAKYNDDNRILNLGQDYAAIQFFQDHIAGSPIIVEGHTEEYRWGSRFSIYTGLPSVVGWSWHVRQHNSLLDGAIVEKRINEVADFYNMEDIQQANVFLNRYHVQYVIVGDLERAYYQSAGIAKFDQMVRDHQLEIVFGDNQPESTVIYKVSN